MPKVLVLFDGAQRDAQTLGDAAAEGASSVRFTEVDLRVAGEQHPTTSTRQKAIGSADAIEQYHGVIIAVTDRTVPAGIETLFDTLGRSRASAFADTVFA